MEADKTFGFFLERNNRHGTEHITARVVPRENGNHHPLGVGFDWNWPKGMYLDGLGIDGFVSDSNDGDYIGHSPEYRDVYSVGMSNAPKMVKTLKAIWKRIDKDAARDPGDMLLSMGKVLGLTFVVVAVSHRPGGAWSDQDYRWMSLGEGRNEFRALIEAAKNDVRARNGKSAAAA